MSLKSFAAPLFFLLFLISSCQKEPDVQLDPVDPQQPPAVSGNLKATINGTAWVATRGAVASRMNQVINITGLSAEGRLLTVTLTDSGVHRYTLNSTSLNAAALVDSTLPDPNGFTTNQSDDASISGGELTITSIDETKKTMTGTFSYRLYRMLDNKKATVTNGTFTDLAYSSSLTPTTGKDTMRLKVDGTAFNPEVLFGIRIDQFDQLNVSGTNTAGNRSIGITMYPAITAGTYQFDGIAGDVIGLYNPDTDGTNARVSDSGTLIVLEHNTSKKRIRGTFQFAGVNLLDDQKKNSITEGYFSIQYQ